MPPLLAAFGLLALFAGFFVFRLRRRERDLATARRAQEELELRLERAETHLRHAERLARVAPYEVRLDTFEVQGSPRIFEVLGLDPRERPVLDASSMDRFVHPEDRQALRATVSAVSRNNRSLDVEFRVLRPDGSVRHVQIAAEIARRVRGRPSLLLGTLLDVTDRYQAGQLREYGAAVLLSAADAIVSTDADGRITTWNRGAEGMLGYTADEIIGRRVEDLWVVDATTARELREQALHGRDVLSREIPARRRDGTTLTLSVTVSPLRDANGKIIGVSSVAQDVTERRRFERELRQRQKLEALGTLAGGIAHDFNNLLWVILGNTQLAQRSLGASSCVTPQLERVAGAARRASDLVQRILSFARPSAVAPQPVHLAETIEDCVALLATTAAPDVRIMADLRVQNPWVKAEPAQLSQLVMNLGTNALAAIGAAGTLCFRLSDWEEGIAGEETGERVPCLLLEVSDTGSGIAPEHIDRIFDPFFTTREVGRGSGLGLAIVQGIVTALGGEIELHSALGQGSSFRIRLPRCAPAEAPIVSPPARTAPAGAPGKGEEILAVDDDPQSLALLASLLEEAGYRVYPCSDPVAALAAFEAEPDRFRLVITDQRMPRLSGSELLARMRAQCPSLRALLLTGFFDPLGEGPLAEGTIRKPIESRELIGRVQLLLEDARGARPELS